MGDIIAAYEDRHHPINDAQPREVLRLLMEQNNLRQKNLAGELASQSVVSEILSGKREIHARQVKVLATRFAQWASSDKREILERLFLWPIF